MPDMIAVLDGLAALNPSGSGGANYSGGSDFFPGAPTLPSSGGLAALDPRWFPRQQFASIEEAYSAQGVDGDAPQMPDDYGQYLAAFAAGSSFTATRGADSHLNPSGSGGANYSGGSDFFPGAPTLPSSGGLAGGVIGGYEVSRSRNVSASGGANRSGGSDFFPGAPTMPSSEGLARVRALHGYLAAGIDPAQAVQMARRWRAY